MRRKTTPDTMSIGERSIARHRELGGKVGTALTAKIRDRRDLSLYYTPGVGAVSSYLAEHPDEARSMTVRRNTVAVVSDGSAVLGLGNIGPLAALPVMEGKAMLFKSLAGVDAVPVVLSTQDPDAIVATVQAIAPSFGAINLEDIAAPQCFDIERRLKTLLDIPVMHDDQHGTAMVVLAGLMNALKVRGTDHKDVRIVISGAGAAGLSITDLLLRAGFTDIVVTDSQGAIYEGRADLNAEKAKLAELTNTVCRIDRDDPRCAVGDLAGSIAHADVFVGVSKPGVLTADMVRSMNPQPIVFALANPVPEIMPAEARQAGALVVATGRSDFPNQINNALGFPGIFRGALDRRVRSITDDMLVRAARNLAALIEHPTPGRIIPGPFDKRVVPAVADAIREA